MGLSCHCTNRCRDLTADLLRGPLEARIMRVRVHHHCVGGIRSGTVALRGTPSLLSKGSCEEITTRRMKPLLAALAIPALLIYPTPFVSQCLHHEPDASCCPKRKGAGWQDRRRTRELPGPDYVGTCPVRPASSRSSMIAQNAWPYLLSDPAAGVAGPPPLWEKLIEL
jgi:hypothetical protein